MTPLGSTDYGTDQKKLEQEHGRTLGISSKIVY